MIAMCTNHLMLAHHLRVKEVVDGNLIILISSIAPVAGGAAEQKRRRGVYQFSVFYTFTNLTAWLYIHGFLCEILLL